MRRHRSNLLLRGQGALVNPSTVHAVAKPSEVAKAARMPNRRIVIESAVGARALRASGSAQGSRQWARWARDRGSLCGWAQQELRVSAGGQHVSDPLDAWDALAFCRWRKLRTLEIEPQDRPCGPEAFMRHQTLFLFLV